MPPVSSRCCFRVFSIITPVITCSRDLFTAFIGAGISVLTVLFVVVNPFFEELIVRGYTISEITPLGGSPNLAIFVSVLIQMSYQVYRGLLRCIALTAVFLVFSIYFSRTRKIAPVIVAHFWSDARALISVAF